MTDLSDDARTLLARAKQERRVSPAALARVRSNVLRRAGVSAAVGAVGTALAVKTAAAPAAPAAGWLLAAKVLGGIVLASAVAVGGIAIERNAAHDASAPAVQTATPSVVARPTATSVTATTAPSAETAEAPAEPAPARAITNAPSAAARASAPAAAPSSTAPSAPTVSSVTEAVWAADLALLHDAQSSMVAGDPQRARALAERVTKGGPFDGERGALLAIADCKLVAHDADRAAAQQRSAAFVSAHHGTSLASRVRAACTESASPLP